MKHPALLALLLLAAATLSACSASEKTSTRGPQWIAQNPNLQFDFTVPIYNDPVFLGVKVNVSFNGMARFYLLRDDQPYTRIQTASLSPDEMAYLAGLFEEANLAMYPEIVPEGGLVSTPPSMVKLGYRSRKGQPYQRVWGAVARHRDEAAYPNGFIDLLDNLTAFVAGELTASASGSHAGLRQVGDRRAGAPIP